MSSQKKINEIKKLQKQGDRYSVEKIALFLKDDDMTVKLTTIEVLGELPKSKYIKSILISLTDYNDEEVRYYALEALRGYTGEDLFETAIKLFNDNDELVRISVVQLLVEMGYPDGLEYLIKALADNEELVRSYAAEGIGKLGSTASIPLLELNLLCETSTLAKLGFLVGLYLLGEEKYLIQILDLLEDPSYKVRCAVANTVVDLVNEENRNLIKQSLLLALKNEETNAARSSMEGAINELK